MVLTTLYCTFPLKIIQFPRAYKMIPMVNLKFFKELSPLTETDEIELKSKIIQKIFV